METVCDLAPPEVEPRPSSRVTGDGASSNSTEPTDPKSRTASNIREQLPLPKFDRNGSRLPSVTAPALPSAHENDDEEDDGGMLTPISPKRIAALMKSSNAFTAAGAPNKRSAQGSRKSVVNKGAAGGRKASITGGRDGGGGRQRMGSISQGNGAPTPTPPMASLGIGLGLGEGGPPATGQKYPITAPSPRQRTLSVLFS